MSTSCFSGLDTCAHTCVDIIYSNFKLQNMLSRIRILCKIRVVYVPCTLWQWTNRKTTLYCSPLNRSIAVPGYICSKSATIVEYFFPKSWTLICKGFPLSIFWKDGECIMSTALWRCSSLSSTTRVTSEIWSLCWNRWPGSAICNGRCRLTCVAVECRRR